jgi:hypothetical protein
LRDALLQGGVPQVQAYRRSCSRRATLIPRRAALFIVLDYWGRAGVGVYHGVEDV